MKTRKWLFPLALTLALVVTGVVALGVVRMLGWWLFASSVKPHVARTTAPVTAAQAKAECPIPLPDSATNVQYAVYAEFVAFEAFVRFDAPVADCVEHAKRVLQLHNEKNPHNQVLLDLRPIAGPSSQPSPPYGAGVGAPSPFPENRFGPDGKALEWFDVDQIARGFTGGENSSNKPQVWVDTDRGVFYYRMTD